MYTKEDFNKVWKDSTREDILNQFYCDHVVLVEANDNWCLLKKWLEEKVNEDWDFSTGERNAYDAYDNALDRMKEIEEGRNERG